MRDSRHVQHTSAGFIQQEEEYIRREIEGGGTPSEEFQQRQQRYEKLTKIYMEVKVFINDKQTLQLEWQAELPSTSPLPRIRINVSGTEATANDDR